MSSPAVFFDRDGTLIQNVPYPNRVEDVHVFPGTREVLEKLRAAGFLNIIVTNQSGFARGLVTPDGYKAVHGAMLLALGPENIAGTYMCPDFAERRKPSPEMVFEAARDFEIDLSRSFFIGDKASDVECGQRAGVRTIFVETGCDLEGGVKPDFVAKDLAAAADYILAGARA